MVVGPVGEPYAFGVFGKAFVGFASLGFLVGVDGVQEAAERQAERAVLMPEYVAAPEGCLGEMVEQ